MQKNKQHLGADLETIPEQTKTALVAGGCFWCVEADLEKLPGVVRVIAGYAGGTTEHPTYENYSDGGHREVVEVTYDATKLSYRQLVEFFIKHIDPTDGGGSFHDRGFQYAPALYYSTDDEKKDADEVLARIEATCVYKKPLAVLVLPRPEFWAAEEYHQDYYKKNTLKYGFYRTASGRDAFAKKHWGPMVCQITEVGPEGTAHEAWKAFKKPDEATLRTKLTPLQYTVPPFCVTVYCNGVSFVRSVASSGVLNAFHASCAVPSGPTSVI